MIDEKTLRNPSAAPLRSNVFFIARIANAIRSNLQLIQVIRLAAAPYFGVRHRNRAINYATIYSHPNAEIDTIILHRMTRRQHAYFRYEYPRDDDYEHIKSIALRNV